MFGNGGSMSVQGEQTQRQPRRRSIIKFTRILAEDPVGVVVAPSGERSERLDGARTAERVVRVRRVITLEDTSLLPSSRSEKRLQPCCRPASTATTTVTTTTTIATALAAATITPQSEQQHSKLISSRKGGKIIRSAIMETVKKKDGNKDVKGNQTDKKINRSSGRGRIEETNSAKSIQLCPRPSRATPTRLRSFVNVQSKVDTSLNKKNARTKVSNNKVGSEQRLIISKVESSIVSIASTSSAAAAPSEVIVPAAASFVTLAAAAAAAPSFALPTVATPDVSLAAAARPSVTLAAEEAAPPLTPTEAVRDALTQCTLEERKPETADVATETMEPVEKKRRDHCRDVHIQTDCLRAPRLALRRAAATATLVPPRVPTCPFSVLSVLRSPPSPEEPDTIAQPEPISQQFRKELNFVESFVESLRFLERSCAAEGTAVSDTGDDTLCMLNVMIRDERRRANNSLFVLKMREEALKEFTKSQVVWLESRKRGGGEDATTLKKKQRAALLRLQHECGEMRRVRSALLAAAERRRTALRHTRRSLLTSTVGGTDATGASAAAAVTAAPTTFVDVAATTATVAPPAIAPPAPATATTAVDGAYLNMVLRELSLPGMFSAGKQYEVDGSALRDVIESAATRRPPPTAASEPSSPSTARSLLDELDDYFPPSGEKEPEAEENVSPDEVAAKMEDSAQVPVEAEKEEAAKEEAAKAEVAVVRLMERAGERVGDGVVAPLSEEEELKRKQLAIELEIKALERQQSLVVVREIPDKPPPPYTPPPTAVAAAVATIAYPAGAHRDRVLTYVRDYCASPSAAAAAAPPGSLDELLQELCCEATAAAGAAGEARARDAEAVRRRVLAEVSSALGVAGERDGAAEAAPMPRRADYIERALLAEWRRREAEWSALEADERAVKEQLCADILDVLLRTELAECVPPPPPAPALLGR